MNEKKFRAWNTVKNAFEHPYPHPFYIIGETTVFDVLKGLPIKEYNNLVIEQYARVKDKNNVELYIGDIYKWFQYLVEKGKQIKREHRIVILDEIPELFYLKNRAESVGVEKIGNVHHNSHLLIANENPELLKGE